MRGITLMFICMFMIPYTIIILNPKNEELVRHLLIVCCLPQYVLFSIELTQMWKSGLSYFQGWNLTDFTLFVVFQTYVQLELQKGIDDQSGIFPLLKLMIFVMAFAKILFFIRIFESFGFLINMIKYTLIDLVPFMTSWVTLLCTFSTCFIVLQMEVDPEVDEAEGVGLFFKTLL